MTERDRATLGARAGESRIGELLPAALVEGEAPTDDATAKLLEEVSLWRSEKMRAVLRVVQEAARTDATVLIWGETGTGKDLTARLVHHFSPRRNGPFVKVNCAAVPTELLESELFGHERGAFTGAHQVKIGRFEYADHGSLFLDEVGDLHATLQAKLLHVLQGREFSRIGSSATIRVDTRIIAATNQDLEAAIGTGRFRTDLYFRLNVIPIVVPPLRERREEIPSLVEHFVRLYARQFQREGFCLPKPSIGRLLRYDYPGNIRELENIVKRSILLDDPLMVKTLPLASMRQNGLAMSPHPSRPLKDIALHAARAAEREAISKALDETAWNRRRAAKLLRISYRAMLYKIKDLALNGQPGSHRIRGRHGPQEDERTRTVSWSRGNMIFEKVLGDVDQPRNLAKSVTVE